MALTRPKIFIATLWLSSALPIAIALLTLPPTGQKIIWGAAILLDNAHRLSPIAAGWSHGGFRAVLLTNPRRTIGLPMLLLAVASGIGAVTSLGWTSFVFVRGRQWVITDLSNPFPILVWVYTIWNAYHFGMQNFGIISLLRDRRSSWQRTCDMTWTCGVTLVAMLLTPGMVEFNHWITELGLCGRVSRHALFLIASMLAFGALGFLWMVPTPQGMLMWVIPVLLGSQIGLGFWHFLQDRWMWKLSDPRVRATIGQSLGFGQLSTGVRQ
jgi:hypothetical protein